MKSDNKTIQDKVTELDKLVEWFQGDDFQLEDAKARLKKAAELAAEIEKDLTSVANEIKEVKKSFQSESEA
jgi:exonuclease VII small subunit